MKKYNENYHEAGHRLVYLYTSALAMVISVITITCHYLMLHI